MLYDRNREDGNAQLFNDYFAENPVYPEDKFRRRFRMHEHVFLRIVEKVTSTETYLQESKDAAGRDSFSSLQKCTATMRVLAYGSAGDAINEYLRMNEQVTKECVTTFVEGVIQHFDREYLRRPNKHDLERLLREGEKRGFPGSLNDINVLNRSHIFQDLFEGRAPKVNYVVNGKQYNMGYYLTNGIYPSWAAFVKSISNPVLRKHKLFASHQESVRKDVERAFGVLQARFAFIRKPCLIWDDRFMRKIIMACIIMHNMIVEDERHTYQNYDPSEFVEDGNNNVDQSSGTIRQTSILEYMANKEAVQNSESNETLRNDFIEHIWEKFGNNN